MSLNLSKLENVITIGDKTTARCPACAELKEDIAGDNLVVYPTGKYGCIKYKDEDSHSKRIYAIAGELDSNSNNIPISQPKKTTQLKTHLTVDDAVKALIWSIEQKKNIKYHEVKRWAYHNIKDELYAYMVRFDPPNDHENKTFRAIAKVDGGWQCRDPKQWFPYRLPDILKSTDTIFICEGEKAVNAGYVINLLCTTSSHGSGSPEITNWESLKGRDIVILPDNDENGRIYAKHVEKLIYQIVNSICIIELPGLPPKGDIYDFIEDRGAQDTEDIRKEILALVPPPKPIATPIPITTTEEFYYEKYSKEYLLRNQRKSWMALSETQFKKELAYRGMYIKAQKGENVSEADEFIIKIRDTKDIDYAGPLAGYESGFYEVNGNRVLVTSSPIIMKPIFGEFKTIAAIIKGLLHDENKNQIPYLFAWLKIAYESISSKKLRPGQTLAFCGPKNSGKTLLQLIITEIIGGRAEKPYKYMTGLTEFNGSLFKAEHLMIEDEPANTDLRVRRAFGAQIKQIAGTELQRCHSKYKEALILTPFWRLTISINDEPENLMVLPPIDDSIEDKIMIFKTYAHDMPMPSESSDERDAFMKQIKSEIPAFIYYLCNWKIPEELLFPKKDAARYGVKKFHHPDVLREIDSLSPEYRLLNIIDKEIFGDEPLFTWTGTAEDLEVKLTSQGNMQHESRKLLSWNNAVGTYLGRLAKKYPDRFIQKRTEHARSWTIEPPQTIGLQNDG
jgi:hypothetical protein